MNCDKCQTLISDLLDDSLTHEDQATLELHLEECLSCADVRGDLRALVDFSRSQRGVYSAPPNEKALWQRIQNVIEAEAGVAAAVTAKPARGWTSWMSRSWELSFPQLAASAAAIVLIVALSTVVGLRRWQSGEPTRQNATVDENSLGLAAANLRSRISQQQQAINYWNQRVEFNKERWSPQMRETFDRNLKVIDETVKNSFDALSQNPHDEVSEEMLNAALNEKLSLLKEFAEL